MNKKELEERTKKFAVAVVFFVGGLPRGSVPDVLGHQLLRSGTSVGANYREANRAESKSDFAHKIAIVEKEASETVYWLELFQETGVGPPEKLRPLLDEARELLAIFTSSLRTLKACSR
ncbi:MAG: four helix bundle protein [Deltaproteobacteria bacterium]|nr:four helix bundle protein [Deltaproteobacteria bacterium]